MCRRFLVTKFLIFANECGDGAFQGSLRGISGHQKWIETGDNDACSWNDTPSEDIIESTDRTGGGARGGMT